MAKGKLGSKTNPLTAEDLERAERRLAAMNLVRDKKYEIIKADMKDGYCNYDFVITDGPGSGARHGVKDSTHIAEQSLLKHFEKFHVHMAVISGAFSEAGIDIVDIDTLHDHDITGLFLVTGFELSGSIDAPKIKLVGNKYVAESRGRIEIKTHKVPIDNLGGYKWYNELKQAGDDACLEVALYKEGFYVPIKDEEEEDPGQLQAEFSPSENGDGMDSEAFENGKVK